MKFGIPSLTSLLGAVGSFRGFAGTVSKVSDLVGRYRDAGVQLLISSAFKNDKETHELFASDVIPHLSDARVPACRTRNRR